MSKIFFFILLITISINSQIKKNKNNKKKTQQQTFVFLDTETTGVSKTDKIIEIAAIKYFFNYKTKKYTKEKIFLQKINPLRNISKNAMKIHKIKQEELSDKPIFSNIAKDFLKFIEGSILIAYNASFDLRMINQELENMNHKKRLKKAIDALDLAKKSFKKVNYQEKQYTLSNIAKKLKIEIPNDLHNALPDAQLLYEVYKKLTEKVPTLHDYGFNNIKNKKINTKKCEILKIKT